MVLVCYLVVWLISTCFVIQSYFFLFCCYIANTQCEGVMIWSHGRRESVWISLRQMTHFNTFPVSMEVLKWFTNITAWWLLLISGRDEEGWRRRGRPQICVHSLTFVGDTLEIFHWSKLGLMRLSLKSPEMVHNYTTARTNQGAQTHMESVSPTNVRRLRTLSQASSLVTFKTNFYSFIFFIS